jgi:hypothetical protein
MTAEINKNTPEQAGKIKTIGDIVVAQLRANKDVYVAGKLKYINGQEHYTKVFISPREKPIVNPATLNTFSLGLVKYLNPKTAFSSEDSRINSIGEWVVGSLFLVEKSGEKKEYISKKSTIFDIDGKKVGEEPTKKNTTTTALIDSVKIFVYPNSMIAKAVFEDQNGSVQTMSEKQQMKRIQRMNCSFSLMPQHVNLPNLIGEGSSLWKNA